jgi:peptidoglycan/LPS O-acetylase OafA/YrhL
MQTATFSSHNYRPDIDGLRALAILSVLIFHAFPNWLQGGFIGVDIFFVISGFLISTIIFENLDQGTFSFYEFYARRIKRIFPALILILFVCFVIGWFVLFTNEFKQLGKHIFGASTFISNFFLWRESGYFDNEADTKILLHLWSLGIEEQFYIIWPFLVWITYKNRRNLLIVSILISLCSFFLCLSKANADIIANFYSPLTRFWELTLGSLSAWLVIYKPSYIVNIFRANLSSFLSIAALFLLFYGFFFISSRNVFPGFWALIPIFGTVFLILSGPEAYINRNILSNKYVSWFGLISFPLYLWHWPLLSFARILMHQTPSINIRLFIVFISIFLSFLTYKFIEVPIRRGIHNKFQILTLVFFMACISFAGIYTYVNQGISNRYIESINEFNTGYDGGIPNDLVKPCNFDKKYDTKFVLCYVDQRPPLKFALLGDSKAAAIWPGILRASKNEGHWMFVGGNGKFGSPVPIISDLPAYSKNQEAIKSAVSIIKNNQQIKVVVLVSATRALFQLKNDNDLNDLQSSPNYDNALHGIEAVIHSLILAGKDVVIVEDNPTLAHPEDCQIRRSNIKFIDYLLPDEAPSQKCNITITRHLALSEKYTKLLLALKNKFPNKFHVFKTLKFYCDEGSDVCSQKDHKTGRYLYSYTDHISDFAASKVGLELNNFVVSISKDK